MLKHLYPTYAVPPIRFGLTRGLTPPSARLLRSSRRRVESAFFQRRPWVNLSAAKKRRCSRKNTVGGEIERHILGLRVNPAAFATQPLNH